jgi:hypothetical protein
MLLMSPLGAGINGTWIDLYVKRVQKFLTESHSRIYIQEDEIGCVRIGPGIFGRDGTFKIYEAVKPRLTQVFLA